jgi:hypothetical protein
MNDTRRKSKSLPVLAAAALLVVLAASLGARLIAREAPVGIASAPPATVPAPNVVSIDELEIPCWSCPTAKQWAIRFQTDLDLLAPLGTGPGNAADWFAEFARHAGPRRFEAAAARKRLIEGPVGVGQVLPPDDPLLLEAEPWCDQATMSFYPRSFAFAGHTTEITDLLLPLNLVRSWVARGLAAADSEVAMEDFRRAIRLGRLLRQEDLVVISDLVGLACIHVGTRAVYRRALADGDFETALLASAVLGEVAPQRLRTMEAITATDLADSLSDDGRGTVGLSLRPGKLERLIEVAGSGPDRRLRVEAILGLNIVRSVGSAEEREQAHEVLDVLARDADPMLAVAATWGRDQETSGDQLKEWMELPPR